MRPAGMKMAQAALSSTFPLLTQEKNNVDTLWEIADKKENAL